VKDSVVHHAFQRCYTIHATHSAKLVRNICYDTNGHGFFIEDGNEVGNELYWNLAIVVRPIADGPNQLIASDDSPTCFWITNPSNTFAHNVAAGCDNIVSLAFIVTLPHSIC
jgi:hypothetical protein